MSTKAVESAEHQSGSMFPLFIELGTVAAPIVLTAGALAVAGLGAVACYKTFKAAHQIDHDRATLHSWTEINGGKPETH